MKNKQIHVINGHEYVQKIIAKKIGLNVRIQSSEKIKKQIYFKLMAIIPFKIILDNGHELHECLKIYNLDNIVFIEKKDGFLLKKQADLKVIDKKIHKKIKEFNSGVKVSKIIWDGKVKK